MRALICVLREAGREVTGSVELREGLAVPDEHARAFLEHIPVVEPGNPSRPLTFEDGLDYLLALPYNLAGMYAWAELEGRDLHGVLYSDLVEEFKGLSHGAPTGTLKAMGNDEKLAGLKPKSVEPLNGEETFSGSSMTVLEFWQWGFSDLRTNIVRGVGWRSSSSPRPLKIQVRSDTPGTTST